MSSPSTKEIDKTLLALAAGFRGHRARQAGDGDDAEGTANQAEAAGPAPGDGNRANTSSPVSSPPDENVFHSAIDALGEEQTNIEEQPYPEAAQADLLPPPDFKHFFTLVEDSNSGENHHPTVHYIFSDDDPEELTAAVLAAIEQHDASSRDDVEERIVLLDMSADGKEITTISSLSPQWQAVKTSISQAPSWGGASQGGDGGLMIKISGQEVAQHSRKQRGEISGNVDDLVRYFNQLLDSLDEMVGEEDAAVTTDESTVDKSNV